MVFVCHRTVSMAAVYQLNIKYDQDKFRVVISDAKHAVSFPLGYKHVVNEHRVRRKSHDATQEKCPHVVLFNVPRNWFETTSRLLTASKNVTLKAVIEKSYNCAVLHIAVVKMLRKTMITM